MWHAQSKCNVWFDVNSKSSDDAQQSHQTQNTHVLCLQSICLIEGSWTADSQYNVYGWVWIDEVGMNNS